MPELRQNMVTKDWVIIATERARRPEAFRVEGPRTPDAQPPFDPKCPFCVGNEHMSEELHRLDGADGWRLRVLKNKFPALSPEGDRRRRIDGVHRSLNGVGHHEVIVESPVHNTCPALESDDQVTQTLAAFQLRGRTHREDDRIEHIIYFKNHGARAGSSLPHPHTQLIALPVVPQDIRIRNDETRRYFDDYGTCVLCEMMHDEISGQLRLVEISERFVAFVPYAAFSPFHIWIVPRHHRSSFLAVPDEELADLGRLLRRVLRRIYFGLGDPAYNYVIRSAPLRDDVSAHQHWYVSVVPRVSEPAGFELGSAMFINSALPERSADFLRHVELPDPSSRVARGPRR